MIRNNTEESEEIIVVSPFAEEDRNDGYFCRYDGLYGVVACPGQYLPALEESCYATREEVFGNE